MASMAGRTINPVSKIKSAASPIGLIYGAAIALAAILTGLRLVILRGDLAGMALSESIAVVLRGSYQDWVVVFCSGLVALFVCARLKSQRGRWRVALAYLAICILLLLWGAANPVAVRLLGEPVTISWLRYSDIFNSTYIFDSIFHILSPAMMVAGAAGVVAFVALALAISVPVHRFLGTGWRSVFFAGLPMVAILALGLGNGDSTLSQGKLSNPAVAFFQSIFSEGRLTSDFAGLVDGTGVPAKPPVGKAVPIARPEFEPGQIRNVIVIAMESIPAKYTQGFGGTFPVTPNLLKYSAIGQKFDNAYAHAPASNYFLVSLMAAIVPELSPYSMTYTYPDLNLETIGQVLKAQRYRTGFFNSADNRFQNTIGFVSHAGFDTVLDHRDWSCETGIYEFEHASFQFLNTSNDRCTIKPMTDWIDQDPSRPFFITFRTGMTHYPYFTGEEPQTYVEDENLNRFLNAMRVGDDAFGRLMDFLIDRDLLDSTLVIAMGDHGEAFGEHGNFVHAAGLFEENLHVPLVLINPVLFSGESSDLIAGVSDIAPTILDLLGVRKPRSWQGQSLYAPERSNGVLFFAPWNGFQIGFREGTKKFFHNINSGDSWLFDLAADPHEANNLADTAPEEVAQAKAVLAEWIAVQNAWTDHLLKGEDALYSVASVSGISELVIQATGTRFKTAPKARVTLDGELIGEFEVSRAPINAEHAVSQQQIDQALSTFTYTTPDLHCAKQIIIQFLNDEWAGENLTGDTDLYIKRVDLAGTRYRPQEFKLNTERAGGIRGDYFTLWRKGSLRVDLEVGPECITEDLTTQ